MPTETEEKNCVNFVPKKLKNSAASSFLHADLCLRKREDMEKSVLTGLVFTSFGCFWAVCFGVF